MRAFIISSMVAVAALTGFGITRLVRAEAVVTAFMANADAMEAQLATVQNEAAERAIMEARR